MCLTVNKEKFKIEIAQEDIVVYKVLEKHEKDVISPYQNFVYEIGKEYKTIMKMRSFCSLYTIHEGFHSLLNKEDAEDEKMDIQRSMIADTGWDFCCFQCIIPKGSNIVYGKYGAKDAIVSEAIKIIEEL